ncbi:MAG: hypothetical protein AB9903_22565 [Vulcanimicrobiota bacterium]
MNTISETNTGFSQIGSQDLQPAGSAQTGAARTVDTSRLEQEGILPVEGLSSQEKGDVNTFLNNASTSIDQLRFPFEFPKLSDGRTEEPSQMMAQGGGTGFDGSYENSGGTMMAAANNVEEKKSSIQEYDSYFQNANKEACAVNTNKSTGLNPFKANVSPVRAMNEKEYRQTKDAIDRIKREADQSNDPKKKGTAKRLQDMLDKGWILADDSLESSVLAETRGDTSRKLPLYPTGSAEGCPKNGNIYLNFKEADYSFSAPGYANHTAARDHYKKLLDDPNVDAATKERARKNYDKEAQYLKEYAAKVPISLESTLVHEEEHTRQNLPYENDAYNYEILYLNERLKHATTSEEKSAIQTKLQEVKDNKETNTWGVFKTYPEGTR